MEKQLEIPLRTAITYLDQNDHRYAIIGGIALAQQYGNLDQNYVEEWLSQFAEALENEEILARYEQLAEKINSLR